MLDLTEKVDRMSAGSVVFMNNSDPDDGIHKTVGADGLPHIGTYLTSGDPLCRYVHVHV